MKFLILMIVYLSSIVAIGQEKPSAVLVDEFGPIMCDEMLARIDSFYIQLNHDQTAKGMVMISGSNESLIDKLKLEVRFTSGVIQRRQQPERVTLIRGKENGEAKMSFWLIPAGAEDPEQAVTTWNLTIPKKTKPFYFHSSYDGICSYQTVYELLKELLAANPRLRINAVLGEQNSKNFRREIKAVRENLGAVNVTRLRFFRARESFDAAEFWLLP